MCYDPKDLDSHQLWLPYKRHDSKKGMLIKVGNDLFRVLELHHVTPGNKRGFVRVKFRNIRNGALADQKFRAEEDVERAIARRARDAVSLQRRRLVPLHGHELATSRCTSTPKRSATR